MDTKVKARCLILGRHNGRSLARAATAAIMVTCGPLLLASLQSDRNGAGKPWTVARTPDGQPDLQGTWTNYDQTPFEQLRKEEIAARGPAVSTQDWLVQDSPASPRRPSMVVEPPDGRVPLKPQAIEKRDAAATLDSDAPERYGPWERCITRGVPGSMWPGAYNNGHQIVQTPGFVVLHSEMIHEARVIPLDRRPHLGPATRSWDGDSRGHWEGDTLVINTTNFHGRGWIATNVAAGRLRGIELSQAAHVVERLTRVSEETIQYEAIINDPNVYTTTWKVAFPLNKDERYRIFEYACHEGNYALGHMLQPSARP
jgi:hypothetical protein